MAESSLEFIKSYVSGLYNGQMFDPNTGVKAAFRAEATKYVNPSFLDSEMLDYIKASLTSYKLTVKPATASTLGAVKLGDGLNVTADGLVSVKVGTGMSVDATTKSIGLNIGKGLVIDETTGELKAGLSLKVLSGNFSETGCVFTLEETTMLPAEFMVTNPTPLDNPNGTLGEVWVKKETGKITVYNSGSFTGPFEMSYSQL